MNKGSQIYTIFGEVEAIASEQMQLQKIPLEQFVAGVDLFNNAGKLAKYAVIVPKRRVAEFDRLIATLRA